MTKKANPAKNIAPVEDAPEEKDPLAPRGGFTYFDISQITDILSKALDELDGFAHRWAWYVLDLSKPFMKAHTATVEKHKDHEAHSKAMAKLRAEARKAGLDRIEPDKLEALYQQNKDYADHSEKLLRGDCPLEIRPFRSEWLADMKHASPALSRLLMRYDLIDRPVAEAMEDLLYGDGKK